MSTFRLEPKSLKFENLRFTAWAKGKTHEQLIVGIIDCCAYNTHNHYHVSKVCLILAFFVDLIALKGNFSELCVKLSPILSWLVKHVLLLLETQNTLQKTLSG